GDARTGAIIDVANVVVFGSIGIVVAAKVRSHAFPRDDSSRFLKPSVRVDQLRSDQAHAYIRERCDERVEPARRDQRIVVEKNDDSATSCAGAAVAGWDEPEVRCIAQQLPAL